MKVAGDTGRRVRTGERRLGVETGEGGAGPRQNGGVGSPGDRLLALSSHIGPGIGPGKSSSAFSVSNTGDKCLHSSARE